MTGKEIRVRCIEALSRSGVREVPRLISDAGQLEKWVLAAQEKEPSPARRMAKKTADKD